VNTSESSACAEVTARTPSKAARNFDMDFMTGSSDYCVSTSDVLMSVTTFVPTGVTMSTAARG
jgi:hypothetical protein